jgi:hypothetical protein
MIMRLRLFVAALALWAGAVACGGGGGSTGITSSMTPAAAVTPNPTVTYLSGGTSSGTMAAFAVSVSGSTGITGFEFGGFSAPAAQSTASPLVLTLGQTTTIQVAAGQTGFSTFVILPGTSALAVGVSDGKCVSQSVSATSTNYLVILSAASSDPLPCGAVLMSDFLSANGILLATPTFVQVAH